MAIAPVTLWFGWRQIEQPLQALGVRAAQLAWGRFEAIEPPVGGIAEVRRLQAELVHLAHKVRVAQQGLRSYIGAITSGQENERRRLARERHDDTLQALIALYQQIQLAVTDQPTAQSLTQLNALAEQTIANLRRITRALRPIYLEDLGLAAALEMLAREVSEANTPPVEFHCGGPERRLAAESELALYHLAQEALSNVVRHSQAARATLSLTYMREAVTLAVCDDGRGFSVPDSPAEFVPSGHFGLLGMYERAELIGAQLRLESAPNWGTRPHVTLPTPGVQDPSPVNPPPKSLMRLRPNCAWPASGFAVTSWLEAIVMNDKRSIPALSFDLLTRLYDAMLRCVMREGGARTRVISGPGP